MTTMLKKAVESANYISSRFDKGFKPAVGIILGTGLASLANAITNKVRIPYDEIPHFLLSTAHSHSSFVTAGSLAGSSVIALEGRFHYYEGYSLEQITFPIRVMKQLNIQYLIVSNAAGGINLGYDKGDIVIIDDHINFMGVNPLIGKNDETLGPRFPDMSEPYSRELISIADDSARQLSLKVKHGVYLAITGPSLETKAEYKMFRMLGADCIGMSTVPEVITAVHSGIKTLGVSVITDICIPERLEPANIIDIIDTANKAEPKLTALIIEVVKRLP